MDIDSKKVNEEEPQTPSPLTIRSVRSVRFGRIIRRRSHHLENVVSMKWNNRWQTDDHATPHGLIRASLGVSTINVSMDLSKTHCPWTGPRAWRSGDRSGIREHSPGIIIPQIAINLLVVVGRIVHLTHCDIDLLRISAAMFRTERDIVQ